MDAVVQFVRNALCTVKNFSLLSDTFLYDPKVTAQYYTFPSPLDQTTPLEILISVTQFYAFVSVTRSGFGLLSRGGVKKLHLIQRLMNIKAKTGKEETKKSKDDKAKSVSESVARRLVIESLMKEGDAAARSTFIGVNVLAIGIAFFWLFANSYHVTSTDWIGGIVGLIHALTVMEVALVFLLYYMLKDATSWIRKSFQMKEFAKKVSPSQIEKITVEQYSWMVDGWSPFWTEASNSTVGAEEMMLAKEEEAVATHIAAFLKKVDSDTVGRIAIESRISLFEGYREYLYFILNFFAFYGYMVCIVVFYFPDEATQPQYIRSMLFNMSNADVDWLGNAVGDFAWTVEPVVILTSPMILNSMKPKKSKKKVD
jgi:hypothetical protein